MGQPRGSVFIDSVLLPAAGVIVGGLFFGLLGMAIGGLLGLGVGLLHSSSVERTSDEEEIEELGRRVKELERRVEELEDATRGESNTE